ncbi:MAG TPA: ABC transporter substrate-binding protein [Candidatus Eisenbacteria bacterium]
MPPCSTALFPPLLAALLGVPLAGCSPAPPPARSSVDWVAGSAAPAFDPDGPPDALRWALERQLSQGLVERDSTGRVRGVLVDSIACSPDSLRWTFRLRAGLRFTDGSPATSRHVAEALQGGLAREDHATRAWLLGAVRGIDKVRAGRPLPALGIATPDERTLVLDLARADRRLLEKLAVPGVSTPWKRRAGSWRDAVGVGPYHVGAENPKRSLTLIAAGPVGGIAALADTLHVRFVLGAARAGAVMRLGHADLIWPLPPRTLSQSLPAGWSLERRAAEPPRRLLLVLRADVPPLTRVEARQALARATNREEWASELGPGSIVIRRWLAGARTPYEWPRLESPSDRLLPAPDARSAPRAGEPPRRPESFHVVLAYDADGAGAEIARTLQGQWARAGHYAELRPLRGPAGTSQLLAAAGAQTQLVVAQALLPGGEAELAQLVLPVRGPAIGSFRTGWRTREFDRWIAAPEPAPGFDPDVIQQRLAEDRVVLPLADLPWRMAFRNGGTRPRVHPAFGPGWTTVNSPPLGVRTR